MDPEIVDAVENHRVEPLTHLMWRRADLDFRSIDHLLRSLETRPPHPGADPPAGGGGSSVAAADGARSGDRRPGARARPRRAAVGGLPGAGLPQADDRCACAPAGAALPLPDQGPPAERLGRGPDRAPRPHRWRHRPADPAHRPCAHLVLHRATAPTGSPTPATGRRARRRSRIACRKRCTPPSPSASSTAAARRCIAACKSGSEVVAAVNAADEVIVEGHVVGTLSGLSFSPVSDVDAEEAKPLVRRGAPRARPRARGSRRAAHRRQRRPVQADRDRRHPVAPRHRGEPQARRRPAASAARAEGRRPARWRIPPHDRPAPAHLDRCHACSAACGRCSP